MYVRMSNLLPLLGEMLPSLVMDDVSVIRHSSSSWFCGSSYCVNLHKNKPFYSDVITIFGDFHQLSAIKMAFFFKTNYIFFLHKWL
jgi:hypothetical protein